MIESDRRLTTIASILFQYLLCCVWN